MPLRPLSVLAVGNNPLQCCLFWVLHACQSESGLIDQQYVFVTVRDVILMPFEMTCSIGGPGGGVVSISDLINKIYCHGQMTTRPSSQNPSSLPSVSS